VSHARLLAVAVLLIILPGAARAAVLVTIPYSIDVYPNGQPGRVTFNFDVFVQGTDREDEQLFAFDLGLTLEKVSGEGADAVSFAAPYVVKPSSDFVFGDNPTDFSLADHPAPGDTGFVLNAVNHGPLVDVTQGSSKKLATVVYQVDGEAAAPSRYLVRIDPTSTYFLSGDPSRPDPTISADLSDGPTVITVVPEPGTVSLALVAATLILRRRTARPGAGA